MKVLFVYYLSSGGVETLNRHRVKALEKRGFNCHLLYLERGAGHQNISSVPTFVMKQSSEITTLIKNQNYDIIIVCSNHQLLQSIRASGFKGILVYENQGMGNKSATRRYFAKAAPFIQNYSDGILYPKTQFLASLTAAYLPGFPQFSFHNCFDLDSFHYRPGRNIQSPIIGWVGRIEQNKNWKAYLKIGAALVHTFQDLKMWMFIDDTLSQKTQKIQFEKMIESLQLKHRLTVFNSITNSLMAIRYSEIGDSGGFLCPTSRVEGFGYSLVEAMSCRCPVLTTDSEGVKSIVIEDVTGLYFQHDRIEEACQKGGKLLGDKALRNRLTKHALAHITKTFSPERYSAEFLNMYRRLQSSSS